MITLHFRGDLTTPRRDIAEDAEMVSRFSVDLWGKQKKKKTKSWLVWDSIVGTWLGRNDVILLWCLISGHLNRRRKKKKKKAQVILLVVNNSWNWVKLMASLDRAYKVRLRGQV
jgi:hypothetical protein